MLNKKKVCQMDFLALKKIMSLPNHLFTIFESKFTFSIIKNLNLINIGFKPIL